MFVKNSKSLASSLQAPTREPHGLRTAMKPIGWALKAHRSADRASPFSFFRDSLIEKFIHTVFVLNERMEVVHSYGHSDKYLKPLPTGQVNMALINMLKEPLKIPVSTALHRAQSEKCEV